jgi:hypothetical protein
MRNFEAAYDAHTVDGDVAPHQKLLNNLPWAWRQHLRACGKLVADRAPQKQLIHVERKQ